MPDKDLCLLALDGGGIRGLSSLQILKQLMETINPESPPKPCDYFDMIAGTSTGGLLAIMLGRLRMTVDDCINAYVLLSDRIFQKIRYSLTIRGHVQGRFDSKELERVLKEIIVRQGLEEDTLLRDSPNTKCKVFVCATSKENSDTTVHLTSYRSPRGREHLFRTTKIWEAARATSAASSLFDPITIGDFHEEFVDGATGANNPVHELWNEAQDIWPGSGSLEANIKCLVSLGTGIPSLKPFGDHLFEFSQTLRAIATETEKTAERFARDKRQLFSDGRYYRFSVIRGLEDIGAEDSERKNAIVAATSRYIESQDVFNRLQSLAMLIKSSATLSSTEAYYDREGRAAYHAKEWTQAMTLLKQALEGRDHHGLDADGTEETRRYYAEALYFAGEYDLARAQFQSIVVWAEKKFGPEHPKTAERRTSWGYALEACRLSSPAREQFKLAASSFERASNGMDTFDSLRCRYKHGMLASAREAYDRDWPHWPEAEESLRRAAQGFARLSKPEDDEAFAAQIGYATVLLKMCKDQDALSQFRRSLQIARQKHMPPDHPTIQKIQCNIKECEFWLSKPLATRSADRLQTARTRAAQQLQQQQQLLQQKDWRNITGHW